MRNMKRRAALNENTAGATAGTMFRRTLRAIALSLVTPVNARSVVATRRRAKAMRSGSLGRLRPTVRRLRGCHAKAPENQREGEETRRRRRICHAFDHNLLKGTSVSACCERHGLVAGSPGGSHDVG